MKYFAKILEENEPEEISKDEAKSILAGCYKQEAIDDIFDNDKVFRLPTATRIVWNKTDDGFVLMPGFEGIAD